MSTVNRITLVGYLGHDPEVNQLDGGQSVAKFSLATNESYTAKSGEKKTDTEWHRVVFFGKSAENISRYLHKGSLVFVEGKVSSHKYKAKDGQEKISYEVRGRNITFLGKAEKKQSSNEDIPF